ncbi:hypothetical protein SAMN00768000_3091 [Sulfobacillus thermosulfidooxidans DSM 9293]|uniref:Uncharacterized protein n=1 Tax=Sulfobacillus thermosulfidooxidans (strain DSM 9293 / VKM B-1269 / AT-1) TaxID=929705 RepID=A0A1W1WME6_SULTA|nr:hypothetical protein [Sulfobacillus thermosulfidooxidans]SMC06903.1 hypothetical protein SAMN00768000_3091 [Sulfobacillus thermosulfidooxidans DSM 9293]
MIRALAVRLAITLLVGRLVDIWALHVLAENGAPAAWIQAVIR